MKLRELFIGKPVHWLLLVVIVAALAWLGHLKLHVRAFNQFSFIVLGMTAAAVLFMVLLHRRGQRVTREPLDEPAPQEPPG